MESDALKSMSSDELWNLHEQVSSMLTRKMEEEKAKLEERLRKVVNSISHTTIVPSRRLRRPYPNVLPKYQNPENSTETWSGRGRRPRWVQAQLKAGRKLEHFLIARSSTGRHCRTRASFPSMR
jgi:DNA-binding protein H-NS